MPNTHTSSAASPLQIRVSPASDVHYCGYYVLGAVQATGAMPVFDTTPLPKAVKRAPLHHSAALLAGARRIFIDAGDGAQICEDFLEWCDVYGKVNATQDQYTPSQRQKVVPLGPSFGIRIWGIGTTIAMLVRNYFRCRGMITEPRQFAAAYWRQYRHRLPIEDYSPTPHVSSNPDYVFFASTLWRNEPGTNACRLNFVQACKSLRWLRFAGGFAPRSDGITLCPANHIMRERCSLSHYVEQMHRSAVAFNTPAVLQCHGWKLAEFLAMGKAIISTPLSRDLPAPLIHGEHLHIVDGSQESIADAIQELCRNHDYRHRLERNSRLYFDSNLSPRRAIERLLSFPIPSPTQWATDHS